MGLAWDGRPANPADPAREVRFCVFTVAKSGDLHDAVPRDIGASVVKAT
jgi:hypothetical protein